MSPNLPSLETLRREIDRIDDAIQDLIVARTAIVERVREIKRNDPVKIRPGREAEIVRRLVARQKGPFPKRELVRIWRELIVATLSFEGPFSIAVYMPDDAPGLWDIARDQYGSFTPMTRHGTVRGVLQAVRDGQATVGVLPLPQQRERDPWWRYMASSAPGMPRVIARLPVVGPGNGRGDGLEAMAIAAVAPEAGGSDRTCLVFEASRKIGVDQFSQAMTGIGLPPQPLMLWEEAETPNVWLYYADVPGFVSEKDPRWETLRDVLGASIGRHVVLGAYTEPFRAEELVSRHDAREDDGEPGGGVLAALARVVASRVEPPSIVPASKGRASATAARQAKKKGGAKKPAAKPGKTKG